MAWVPWGFCMAWVPWGFCMALVPWGFCMALVPWGFCAQTSLRHQVRLPDTSTRRLLGATVAVQDARTALIFRVGARNAHALGDMSCETAPTLVSGYAPGVVELVDVDIHSPSVHMFMHMFHTYVRTCAHAHGPHMCPCTYPCRCLCTHPCARLCTCPHTSSHISTHISTHTHTSTG